MALKQLFDQSSPVYLPPEDKTAGGVYVKGFASVAIPDRGGDYVPAREFNVAQYLTSPTVLVNHDYWVDRKGNQVSVGVAREVYPASLSYDPTDESVWKVVELDGERTNSIPRASFPTLREGMEGLFAVIEVTDPDIQAKVRSNELSAFSWKGIVAVEYGIGSNGKPMKILRNIDLHEISLVDIPANQAATFIMGKTEDHPDLLIQTVFFDKAVFKNAAMARSYLEYRGFNISDLREDAAGYLSVQEPIESFRKDSLVSIKISPGVTLVAGEYVENNKKNFVAVPDFSERLLASVECHQETPMSKVTLEGNDISVTVGKSDKREEVAEKTVVQPTISSSEVKTTPSGSPASASDFQLLTNRDELENSLVETVTIKFAPMFEKITSTLESLNETVTNLKNLQVEKSVVVDEPVAEAPAEEIVSEEVSDEPVAEDKISDLNQTILERMVDRLEALDASIQTIAVYVDERDQEVNQKFALLQSELDGPQIEPTRRTEAVSKSNSRKNSKGLSSIFDPILGRN